MTKWELNPGLQPINQVKHWEKERSDLPCLLEIGFCEHFESTQ